MMRAGLRGERGVGMFLVFAIMIFLIPILMVFVKRTFRQNQANMAERHLTLARSLANASPADYMKTFSTDYNRDYNNPMFLNRHDPRFGGLGWSEMNTIYDPELQTFSLTSRGFYNRGNGAAVADKGLEGLVAFRNDLYRFSWYWDKPVAGGGGPIQILSDMPIVQNQTLDGSVWTNGALDATGSGVTFKDGLLYVASTFTADASVTLLNVTVICDNYVAVGAGANQPGSTRILQYPTTVPGLPGSITNPMPEALVIAPNRHGIGLEYYKTHFTTNVVTGNRDFSMEFFDAPGVNPDYVHIVGTGAVPSFDYIWNIPINSSATIITVGANVEIFGVITTSITLAILPDSGGLGGDAVVRDDFEYKGAPNGHADNVRSFALLVAGKLKFDKGLPGGPQRVDGFYYAHNGVELTKDIRLKGSIFGLLNQAGAAPGVGTPNGIQVDADDKFYRYQPPYLPKKPCVNRWDFVG